MITPAIQIIEQLQHPTGLFSAAAKTVTTGYNKAWIRDNIYTAMGLETNNPDKAIKTYHALFDIFKKHSYKIDYAIATKPEHAYQYIHARYHPETFDEYWEPWGNKQHDAIGLFLYKVGELLEKGWNIIRDETDTIIIQKLIAYLGSIKYWHEPDNGMWEEAEEIHASSVGACVAGLKKIQSHFSVPKELIIKGEETLYRLLPRESATKDVDLALLSLIYPFHIVTDEQAQHILHNVETQLVRTNGVIRYRGDQYYIYNNLEPAWPLGFSWLALIYKKLGNIPKYKEYLQKTISTLNDKGELPELYYANTNQHNDNTPLGWAQSLFIQAVLEDV